VFLGLMPNLDPKGNMGTAAWQRINGLCPGVWSNALRDPCDMVNSAGLLKPQSPEDAIVHPPERRLKPAPSSVLAWHAGWHNLQS
jgi:hypothetical protein